MAGVTVGEQRAAGLSDVKIGLTRVDSDASTADTLPRLTSPRSDSDEDCCRSVSADDGHACIVHASRSNGAAAAARGYLVEAVALIFASCAALAFLQLPREVQAALLGFGIVRLAVFFLCRGSTMRAASAVALVPAFMLVIAVLLAMMTPAL